MTTNQTIDGVPREQMACVPVERCYDVRAKMIIAFNEAKKAGGDLDDALDAAYKSALRYSPNPLNAEQPAPVAAAQICGFNVVEDPSIPPGQIRMCDCNQGRMPCNGKCAPTI